MRSVGGDDSIWHVGSVFEALVKATRRRGSTNTISVESIFVVAAFPSPLAQVGTGSAPDGDEDAILGMILLLLATRAEAYPERIDELLHNGQHAAPSSFAAAISMMATEDLLAQPAQQQQQAPRHQVRHGEPVHFVQSLEEREQEQPLAQPATATATAVDAPSSGFHLLAGRVAKRTVVALSDSVESFSTGGIPAIWVAIMMVTAVVALFLCCWCMAYCMCMYGTERDAVRAAKSRKPHKRDRMS